jgi:hypothetical protein
LIISEPLKPTIFQQTKQRPCKEKFRELSNFLVESAGTWTVGKCFHFYFEFLPELAEREEKKRSWQAGAQGLIQIRAQSGHCSLSRSLFLSLQDTAQIPTGK